jgi:hypothetical protein
MKLQFVLCVALALTACGSKENRAETLLTAPENAATQFTNEAHGHLPTMNVVNDPAQYYAMRTKAKELVFDQKWSEAQPLLKDLVGRYPDDGDTWYMLGISNMQTENWQEAISALKNTIALGTILSGVPTGSAPSNDIMILIAKCYTALDDPENTKLWAEKSLTARYDDRPFLAGNADFENTLSKDVYQKILGTHLEPGLTRDALWRFDLAYLAGEMRRLHVNLDNAIPKQEFKEHIAEIDTNIPSLTDQEIVFEFMKLVGRMGSGHNLLVPTNGAKGSFSRLPIEFYWFSDGLFVVKASEGFEQFIGSEIISIGGTPIRDALDKTAILNPRDNEMQHLWLSPYYVSLPDVLKGLKIIDDVEAVPLKMIDPEGLPVDVTLSGTDWSFEGFPKLPKQKNSEQPLYLKKSDELFWMETIPEQNAVFVQFNWVSEREGNTLAAFSRRLVDVINTSNLDNLIVDIRHNPGGNGAIIPSLVRAIIYAESANPDGKLFIISGRGTYSAAHNMLTDINRLTNAVIVGEPSGSRPNAISEAGWFKLPHSEMMGLVSSQFHQFSKAEDHRIWIAPHIPISLSSTDYFEGRDPSVEAIFEIIGDNVTAQ